MLSCNMCMLQQFAIEIVDAIKSHKKSFGKSSKIIIHSFSTGGTLVLCAMNELITKKKEYRNIYYDGMITVYKLKIKNKSKYPTKTN